MTIDCMEIESVLGPLRQFNPLANQMISLRSFERFDNLFSSPERARAWSAVKWSDRGEPPISEWLGNVEDVRSHDDVLRRMRVVTFIAFMDVVPVLADGHPWCLIDHQGGGNSCSHIRFIGRRVQLKPEIESNILEIALALYNSQLWWEPSLSELISYRARLQSVGLDCNSPRTYRHLMESFYPIDLTQSVFDRIGQQPFSLESLLGTPRPFGKIEDYATLVIIAPNSD